MPRGRPKYNPKPILHNQKIDRFVVVKYEQIGKRNPFTMEIPASGEVGVNSMLEHYVAKKLGVDTADIWIVDEPYLVTNRKEENEV